MRGREKEREIEEEEEEEGNEEVEEEEGEGRQIQECFVQRQQLILHLINSVQLYPLDIPASPGNITTSSTETVSFLNFPEAAGFN